MRIRQTDPNTTANYSELQRTTANYSDSASMRLVRRALRRTDLDGEVDRQKRSEGVWQSGAVNSSLDLSA